MLIGACNVSQLLAEARIGAGLTQAELARRLGVSQAAVAKLERPGANPTVDTLDRALWATGHRLALEAAPRAGGVDESLIRRQLELTPAQRIRGIETMYAEMRKLTEAGARSRGERA
ncbi:MAG TPA: helix-turn-helix domain-containing protein [Solirubrobacteraceae bacterium]|nr:helix-turn-helix domain-containing protein [Solirubrobacteraceae bacterium]